VTTFQPSRPFFLTGELSHQELGHSNVDKRLAEVQRCQTLGVFSAKLCDETDLDALISEVVGLVRETMQPTHVSLWLRTLPPPRRVEARE
jgi:hypothetical protein